MILLPERPGAGRLGRHYEPPPLAAKLKAAARWATRAARPLVSRTWRRYQAPFDQGDVGDCVLNAYTGCLVTEGPTYTPGLTVTQTMIQGLYRAATRLDSVPGHWEPDDTGTTGTAGCKAGERAGLTGSHHHIFSVNGALQALSHTGSIMIGITWYDSFDVPVGPAARLDISPNAESRGGHELQANLIDVENRRIGGPNSWGEGWGNRGFWSMGWDTFGRLIDEKGDIVQPVPR